MTIFRPTNPLEASTRPPTDAELREMAKARPTTAEVDALLVEMERTRQTPAARWNQIAAALNRRNP